MNPLELKQGSDAWMSYRIGKITASRVRDVMSFTVKGEPTAKRTGYMMELLCERLTGLQAQHYPTDAMAWGQQQEEYAVTAYELQTGNDTQKVGISQHPTLPFFCASADRSVGDYGLLEVKNPTTAKHVGWMLEDIVPEEHLWQMVSQLACEPNRDWVDFLSHDSRLSLRHQNFLKTVRRNQEQIDAVENAVQRFEDELNAWIAKLEARNPAIDLPAPGATWDAALGIDEDDLDRYIPRSSGAFEEGETR